MKFESQADPQREPAEPAQPGAESPAQPEDKLKAERDDLLAQLQRARADYQNLRKRTQVDVENNVRRALEGFLLGVIVAVDNLDFALRAPADSEDARALAKGVELTRGQLLNALAQENVHPIPDALTFDPKLHEAVSIVETSEHAPGSVVLTLRRGWTWRGQVVRAAHVQVAAAPKAPPTQTQG